MVRVNRDFGQYASCVLVVLFLLLVPFTAYASPQNSSCNDSEDCEGRLVCINKVCKEFEESTKTDISSEEVSTQDNSSSAEGVSEDVLNDSGEAGVTLQNEQELIETECVQCVSSEDCGEFYCYQNKCWDDSDSSSSPKEIAMPGCVIKQVEPDKPVEQTKLEESSSEVEASKFKPLRIGIKGGFTAFGKQKLKISGTIGDGEYDTSGMVEGFFDYKVSSGVAIGALLSYDIMKTGGDSTHGVFNLDASLRFLYLMERSGGNTEVYLRFAGGFSTVSIDRNGQSYRGNGGNFQVCPGFQYSWSAWGFFIEPSYKFTHTKWDIAGIGVSQTIHAIFIAGGFMFTL